MTNVVRTLIALLLLTSTCGSRLAEAQDTCAGGFAPSFRVGGQVTTPKTYDLEELRQLPQTRVHNVFIDRGVEEGTFTGVLLWDLIEAAGVIVDPHQENDLLRKYVLITGSDCYEALYSMGELSPWIGGSQPVIVAFQRDGKLLGPDRGMAWIISPGDKSGDRQVYNVARIRVLGRPAPQ
jgi:hypothetical protein